MAMAASVRMICRVPSSRAATPSKSRMNTIFISGPNLGVVALLGHIANEPLRIGEGIVAERNDDALWTGVDLLDMRLAAQNLDRHQFHQLFDFARQRSEAIDHLGREGLDFGISFEARETSVETKPQLQIGGRIPRE